jgi:nitrous oxide reductase accessory protein NosL
MSQKHIQPATGYSSARTNIVAAVCLAVFLGLLPTIIIAADPCGVPHPLNPPDPGFSGACPNCGMRRAMWARTWKSFDGASGHFQLCSFHCLADMARKSGEMPRNVKTALYLAPQRMVPVEEAFFVIGAQIPGTMTLIAKAAFASESAARKFARTCGGRVDRFPETWSEARRTLPREIAMIARKRVQSGKIVTPVDHTDECPVCNMYPARYPRNRCQIKTRDNGVLHFCSTRCLFAFLGAPQKFGGRRKPSGPIWVSDYLDGGWISARTAYFVVGSRAWGPMGYEAFAFDTRTDARHFQQRHGGRILTYPHMRLSEIEAGRATGKE